MSARPSFASIYMGLAENMSQRSTCKRTNSAGELVKVGCAIITPDWRKVIAVGYNGNAAGLPNECDSETPGMCGCIHAEANAVVNCDSPRSTEKIVFSTHLPCVNCFVSGTLVSSPSRIQRAYRRWYEGPVFRVVTRHGEFTVTPNHPVLALDRGFTAVQSLHKGDYLLYSAGNEGPRTSGANHNEGQPIQQVFESLSRTGLSVRSPGASHQFHGDGIADSDVDVVTADGTLKDGRQPALLHLLEEPPLASSDARGMELVLPRPGERTSIAAMNARNNARAGLQQAPLDDPAVYLVEEGELIDRVTPFVRCNDFLYREWYAASAQVSSTTLSALAQDTALAQTVRDSAVRNTVGACKSASAFAREIAADEIISIEEYRWSGHVYNIQTAGGWYSAGTSRIIVQNCAKLLINLGNVKEVVYLHDYRIRRGLELFDAVGIHHRQYKD